MADEDADILIWSNEHRAWWGAGRVGYSRTLDGAGRYTMTAALDICTNAVPMARHVGVISEMPVRLRDVNAVLQSYPSTIPEEITGRPASATATPGGERKW